MSKRRAKMKRFIKEWGNVALVYLGLTLFNITLLILLK